MAFRRRFCELKKQTFSEMHSLSTLIVSHDQSRFCTIRSNANLAALSCQGPDKCNGFIMTVSILTGLSTGWCLTFQGFSPKSVELIRGSNSRHARDKCKSLPLSWGAPSVFAGRRLGSLLSSKLFLHRPSHKC